MENSLVGSTHNIRHKKLIQQNLQALIWITQKYTTRYSDKLFLFLMNRQKLELLLLRDRYRSWSKRRGSGKNRGRVTIVEQGSGGGSENVMLKAEGESWENMQKFMYAYYNV